MENKQMLVEALNCLESKPSHTLKVLLVTRHLKENISKSKKALDKYEYKIGSVQPNKELNEHLFKNLLQELSKMISDEGIQFEDYSVISDDSGDRVFTYKINEVLSFSDVVANQLKSGTDIPSISGLKEVKENLWASCIKIDAIETNFSICSFRKMNSGTVFTEDKGGKKLSCWFGADEAQLEIVKKDIITFDDKVDCVYVNDTFYIPGKRKGAFEQIVGLEEEFKENAQVVFEELRAIRVIQGMEILAEEASKSKQLLRKLANVAKSNNYKNITAARIDNMKAIAKNLKLDLKFTPDGKMLIQEPKDIELVIKMLDKWFVQCLQTQEYFGSHAKTRLNIAK